MKKHLLLFLCVLCSLGASAQFSGSGTGTQSDPYLIFNPIQLNQIRGFLNQSGVYFKLMSDIDLTEWIADNNPNQGWQPVGTVDTPFKGQFDGASHTISGLMMNRPSTDYVGFFARTDGAVIKNVTISGTVSGKDYTGGVIGQAEHSTTVTNVTFKGSISGHDYTGGIAGSSSASLLTSCITHADLTGNNKVGGVLGHGSSSTVSLCYAYGSVEGVGDVGGITGYLDYKTISDCGAIVRINSTGSNTGGIVGETNKCSVLRCFTVGDISSTGNNLGGVIGYYEDSRNGVGIENCYCAAEIHGNQNVGGAVGFVNGSHSDPYVDKFYSAGCIAGSSCVGGIVGYWKSVFLWGNVLCLNL